MSMRYLLLLAPVGAALALGFSSLTGQQVVHAIGLAISDESDATVSWLHLVGIVGWVLLGVGVVAGAMGRRERSTMHVILSLSAIIAFLFAVLMIGYGNWKLIDTFNNLASAESVNPDATIEEAGGARLPLLLGWVLALAGALSFFFAEFSSIRPGREPTHRVPRGLALGAALIGLGALLLAAGWCVLSLRSLQADLSASPMDAAAIARGVSGLLLSTDLAAMGIGAGAFTTLFMMIGAEPPDASTREDRVEVDGPG